MLPAGSEPFGPLSTTDSLGHASHRVRFASADELTFCLRTGAAQRRLSGRRRTVGGAGASAVRTARRASSTGCAPTRERVTARGATARGATARSATAAARCRRSRGATRAGAARAVRTTSHSAGHRPDCCAGRS